MQAFLTNATVTKERRAWAQQPVIVKGLDDRNVGRSGSIVNGGRNERESIVNVYDIGSLSSDKRSHLPVDGVIPHRILRQNNRGNGGDLLVSRRVQQHRVAMLRQQPSLPFEDGVFPSTLLVIVMNEQQLHGGSKPTH
jgi:hypothetical protein